MGGGGPNSCTAGWFNLVFTDNNVGFNDPTWGATYRDIACRVFSDLSVLIVPANEPYTLAPPAPGLVNIELRLPTNPAPGAVGMGSSFYGPINFWNAFLGSVTPVAMQRRVLDGEVWKTINGGYDSWEVQRSTLFPWAFQDAFFHGYVHIDFNQFPNANWHLAPGVPPTAPPFDLYTVIFHEALHGMGIISFLGATGVSQLAGSTYYSRWDMRLHTGGSAVIDDQWQCNALSFSGAAINDDCEMTFTGPNTTQPVHSPDAFNGSSFEHFDGNCPGGLNYLMHPGPISGQSRIPLQEEAFALCDLDFHTTNAVGTDPAWVGTVVTNYTSCGSRIAGVDDMYEYNTQNLLIYQQGQIAPLEIDDFLNNDEDQAKPNTQADEFDPCVEILRGGGTVNVLTATSIDYTPAPGFIGWAVLRYLPINSSTGARGNYTHIFILVSPPNACLAMDCNIVNGGDFELITSYYSEPYSNWRISEQNSPDHLFWNGSNWANGGVPMGALQYPNYCADGLLQPVPPSHNGTPLNDHYISMVGVHYAGSSEPFNQEGVVLDLCLPLEPGQNYLLDFWAMTPGAGCNAVVDFRAFEQRPCLQGMGATDITGGPMNCFDDINSFSAIGFIPGPVTLTDQWVNYQIPFTFPAGANGNWLTAFMSNPVQGAVGSVYIDDIRIRPIITTTPTITPSCNGQNNGAISLDVHYYPGSYTVEWAHGPTTESLTGLAPGTYTVTITDTELGCATYTEEFIVPDANCDGHFTLAKWVTPNSGGTYAGAPVIYHVQVCNTSASVQSGIELDDVLPTNFDAVTNPFPVTNLTLGPGQCQSYEVFGSFNTLGSYTNTATLEHTASSTSLAASVDIDVLQGCPMIVYGSGGCEPGDPVNLCLGVHTQLQNVTAITYHIAYPDILLPPAPGPLVIGTDITAPAAIQAAMTSATIGFPGSLGWAPPPYTGYRSVPVTVTFAAPGVSVSPPYQFFCIPFTLDPNGSGVPSGHNTAWTWASTHQPPGFNNQVTVTVNGSPVQLWTQAYHILFTGCPDITPPNAGFTVQTPNCGGAITVDADLNDPDAIHIWTWGDDRTTPINGAQTYTYDYFEPITDNQGWPVNIPGAAPGTYTITHTVIVDGVAHSSTQQVTLYQCCQAATIVPDGTLASDGLDGFTGTVDIPGVYIVDVDVVFTYAQVYMEPGSQIIVKNGAKLDIRYSSFTSCNGVMWRGITVEDGGRLYTLHSFLDDAENFVTALDGAMVTLKDSQFHNNRVSVHVPTEPNVVQNNIVLAVANNIFYSDGTMPTPYPGQTTAVGATGFAAFDIQRVPLSLTSGWNVFHHLSNGIVADRCDITLRDCAFHYIEPDATYTLTGNGSAIHARATSGWYTLDQVGGLVNGLLPFRECRWALYSMRMNVTSTANRMEQVGTAYHVEKSKGRRVHLYDNLLDTKRDAIELFFNDAALELLVEDNDITFANEPPPGEYTRGYIAIRVEENNGENPASVIRNNTITYRSGVTTAFAGISLTAVAEYLVAGNVLHMTDNTSNYVGVQLLGCSDTEVSCNTVNGATEDYVQSGQAAIRNVKGKRPYISCNTVNKTTNGLLFSGESYGADVRGNHIHKHRWGLHLDGTAIIDAQVLKGNLWYEPAQGMEAWYEVSDPQSLQSLFKVDPITLNGGSTWPPNWSPYDWFTQEPGTTYDCARDHDANYCDQFDGKRCLKCENGLDRRIAADSLTNDPYTEQTKWTLKGDLYAKLDEAPELRDSLPDMEAFHTALQYDVIGLLKAVEDGRGALADVDSTVAAELTANQEQMASVLELAKGALTQLEDTTLTTAQQQAIIATLAGYQQNIRSLAEYNATVAQLARDTKVLTAEGIRAANAALGATELTETNAKQVNEVYLATIGREVDDFTPQQTATLYAIANQCPMVGGNAVFRARALYSLIDAAQDYDDIQLCLQQGIIVKSLRAPATSALNVVPNPASDEATLVLTEVLDGPGVFVVFDALGAEVVRYAVPAETLRHTLNTAALAPALYHYQVRGPSGLLGVGKLTIVR